MKLAQSALLGTFVAEHRPRIKELQRQVLAQSAGDQRPGDSGGPFRAQRDAVASLVGEGVHLLGNNIRRFAERSGKHLAELEHRRGGLLIAVAFGNGSAGIRYVTRTPGLVGEKIVRAADRLKRRHIYILNFKGRKTKVSDWRVIADPPATP